MELIGKCLLDAGRFDELGIKIVELAYALLIYLTCHIDLGEGSPHPFYQTSSKTQLLVAKGDVQEIINQTS